MAISGINLTKEAHTLFETLMAELVEKHKHKDAFDALELLRFLPPSEQISRVEAKQSSISVMRGGIRTNTMIVGEKDYLKGLIHLYVVDPQSDAVKGVARLRTALEKGYTRANYLLYLAYRDGKGVMQNAVQADRYLDTIISLPDSERDNTFCVEKIQEKIKANAQLTEVQLSYMASRSHSRAQSLSSSLDDAKRQEGLKSLYSLVDGRGESKLKVSSKTSGYAALQVARLAAKGVVATKETRKKDDVVLDNYLKVIHNLALPDDVRLKAAKELDIQQCSYEHELEVSLQRVKAFLLEQKGKPPLKAFIQKYSAFEEEAAGNPKIKLLLALAEKHTNWLYSPGNTNKDLRAACKEGKPWAMFAYVYRHIKFKVGYPRDVIFWLKGLFTMPLPEGSIISRADIALLYACLPVGMKRQIKDYYVASLVVKTDTNETKDANDFNVTSSHAVVFSAVTSAPQPTAPLPEVSELNVAMAVVDRDGGLDELAKREGEFNQVEGLEVADDIAAVSQMSHAKSDQVQDDDVVELEPGLVLKAGSRNEAAPVQPAVTCLSAARLSTNRSSFMSTVPSDGQRPKEIQREGVVVSSDATESRVVVLA